MPHHMQRFGNTIMIDRDGTKHDVLDRQERTLRLAERDHGVTARVLSAETGVPLSTVQSWKRSFAPALMSLGDFVAVSRVIPDALTSLCLEPGGKHVGTNGCGDGNLDAVAVHAGDFAHDYAKARHPESPGGTEIVPQEAAKLSEIAGRFTSEARKTA